MAAEHDRRRLKRSQSALVRSASELREQAEYLAAEVRRSRAEVRAQQSSIRSLRSALAAHEIVVLPALLSFRLCAAPTEVCPLGLQTIDECGPPFEGCCPSLDPLNPDKKCAELSCGHRFNAVWVVFFFVRRQTARCPLCQQGPSKFRFQSGTVPECMLEAARRARRI